MSTTTVPPRGVNLMALASRCQTICRSRVASPNTDTSSSGNFVLTTTPFACADETTAAAASRVASSTDTHRDSSRSLPVSALDTSSRSVVSCAWSRTLRSIDSSPRTVVAESSFPVRSKFTQPRIALSGVRNSCEIVARNSSFIRLAASLSCRASCASRARPSATRRAARNSEMTPVSSRPWTTKSARWV